MTLERLEKVACNALVDFVTSHKAKELLVSPNSSVRIVIVANALARVCDVGSIKR